MASERKLTPKQEAFVAEYVKNGGNAKAAAIKAYPEQNENSAAQQGWQNLQKLELARAIRQEFAKQGVTLDKAIRPIVKGLEAKDKDGNHISGTATVVVDDGEAKEVTIDETGKVEYVIDAAPGPHTVDVTFNKENCKARAAKAKNSF